MALVPTIVVCAAAVGTFSIRAQAQDNTTDEIRRLRADNKLLKATVAQRDKTIEALKKDIEALKAEPAQVELEKLRKELADASARIQQLSRELENAKPVERKNLRITDADLTLQSLKEKDIETLQDDHKVRPAQVVLERLSKTLEAHYCGAELLLDGYVVNTDTKDGEFRAVIAAGVEGPVGYSPVLLMRYKGVEYQKQIDVTGEVAAKLRPSDSPLRVRGIIREIKFEKGDMFNRTGLSYLPQTSPGVLIIVTLEDITLR